MGWQTTLFLFALERGQGTPAARWAIVDSMLEAGANANVPPGAPSAYEGTLYQDVKTRRRRCLKCGTRRWRRSW